MGSQTRSAWAQRTASSDQPPRTGAATDHARHRSALEAADGDFEAGNTFLAGDGRLTAAADGGDEGLQLGAQRLGMPDRQMAHRGAAVRLEAEAFGDLPRQQVAHDVFVARRDGDVARFERREPIGVDVGEDTGAGAELQERDVFALGNRVGELRLHFGDIGLGEPADETHVMHGEIDDHAYIRHARRKRTDAGDRDGKDALVADRFLDRLDRGVEALDMPDHQGDAGVPRRRYDRAPLLHRRRDRLLHQDMHAALDAEQRELAMQVRGGRDGDGVDTGRKQQLDIAERRAAERCRNEFALLAVGVCHADELDARKIGEDAGVVAAHDADAHHADAQQAVHAPSGVLHHDKLSSPCRRPSDSLSTMPVGGWRWARSGLWTRFELKSYSYLRALPQVLRQHFWRNCRNQSTKRLTPSPIGVRGRNPTARSRSAVSAQVSGTSPGCIGNSSRTAGLPTACSISLTTSVTSTGWLLPIL